MRSFISQAAKRRQGRGLSGLLAGAAVLTVGAVAAGMAVTAIPAYADVTSSTYTIGSPSGAVASVVASPSTVAKSASTNFRVTFTVGTAVAGSGDGSVTVTPSESLGSTPTSVDLIGSSCIQSGTAGAGGAGSSTATGVTIFLSAACSLNSNTPVEVDFTAVAPGSTGSFTFSVTASGNGAPGTSNTVTVGNSGATLSAASYQLGANTNYTISDVPVANLSSAGTSLTLTAAPTTGSETITFLNGAAGYAVSYTPANGTATADTVVTAAAAGPTVTLTLGTALVSGDTLTVTATGTNPAPNVATQADDVTVQPGNGTAEVTNSIPFGGSVTGVSVSPGSSVAGAQTIYTVDLKASDAVNIGGDIYLNETAGPTNFSTVTGIEVSDLTHSWHFVATGAVLTNGSATIPLQDAITAGDSISVILANVTNPSAAGTISDFSASTTGDPVAANAAPYTIGANASPGVVVTVNPISLGATATYTISNVHASAGLTGGTSTIQLAAPTGTVFPNNPGYYSVVDATTSSGSGTVTAALSGGGTNTVTFTVPNSINSGDVLTITVSDVINPSTASSADSITLHGSVTGPAPTPVTTTTTAPTTTTTKPPPPHPSVTELTAKATVNKNVVGLKLRCTGANCKGELSLTDVKTGVGSRSYTFREGKTVTFALLLNDKGRGYLAGAKGHTIKVTETVTVTGGKTVKEKITLTLAPKKA